MVVGTRLGRPGSTKNFIAYLTREGVGEDGGKGRLFDADDREPATQVFIEESRRDPHQYLWLFSPEAGVTLDLRAWNRDVMAQASKDVGQPLVYLSAAHFNTAHPHVHTVVRGRDAEGHAVWIEPIYLREGLRQQAEDAASRLVWETTEPRDWLQDHGADTPWWLSIDHDLGHSLVPWARGQDRGWER